MDFLIDLMKMEGFVGGKWDTTLVDFKGINLKGFVTFT